MGLLTELLPRLSVARTRKRSRRPGVIVTVALPLPPATLRHAPAADLPLQADRPDGAQPVRRRST